MESESQRFDAEEKQIKMGINWIPKNEKWDGSNYGTCNIQTSARKIVNDVIKRHPFTG